MFTAAVDDEGRQSAGEDGEVRGEGVRGEVLVALGLVKVGPVWGWVRTVRGRATLSGGGNEDIVLDRGGAGMLGVSSACTRGGIAQWDTWHSMVV